MNRQRRVSILGSLLLLAACSDGPSGPPEPVPGMLTVQLTAPATDGAMILDIDGPTLPSPEQVSALGGHRLFARSANGTLKVVLFGSISSGALLQFSVPDVARAGEYKLQVRQVVDLENVPRPTLSGYSATTLR